MSLSLPLTSQAIVFTHMTISLQPLNIMLALLYGEIDRGKLVFLICVWTNHHLMTVLIKRDEITHS